MAYITDNNGSKVSVTINDVMRDIVNAINLTQDEWYDDTLGNCSYPLRLQVVDGSWFIHSGDPQYDTDHRGSWGYGYASYGMTKTAIKALAKELITEAMDS